MGTVYELKRHGSSYLHLELYSFMGGNDGDQPYGGVVFGPGGAIYGATTSGRFENGGVAYSLRNDFSDAGDGAYPTGDLMIDSAGNIYGTNLGDSSGHGVVWELTP